MSQIEDEYEALVNARDDEDDKIEEIEDRPIHNNQEIEEEDVVEDEDDVQKPKVLEKQVLPEPEGTSKSEPAPTATSSKTADNLRRTIHSNRAKTAPLKRSNKTFLTSVPSNEQEEVRRPTTGKKYLKPCMPLRFSGKLEKMVLTDVCPHRKQFNVCKRFFCVAAKEKYEWLELLRTKSEAAIEIVHEADKLWREKLEKSWNESIENLKLQQQEEFAQLKKDLKKKTTNEKLIDQNWKYLKYYELDKKDPIEADCPLPYTKEHVDFIERQTKMHQEIRFAHRKLILDQKIFEQQRDIEELKKSISVPNRHLDKIRDTYLESIDFQTKRAEKILLYVLNISVQPRGPGINVPPEKDDPVLVERVKLSSIKAYQLLKTALGVFGQVCAEIRRIYCNADEDVRRFFAESRKFQKSERLKSPERKSLPRSQSSGVYKSSSRQQVSNKQTTSNRPTTAPNRLQSNSETNPDVRIIDDSTPPYEDDYESHNQSGSKYQRSNSFVDSVGEEIEEDNRGGRDSNSHNEEIVEEDIAENTNEVSEIESEYESSRIRKKSSSIITGSEGKLNKSQGYDSYTDDTDFDENKDTTDSVDNKKKKKKKSKKSRRKQIVKAFLDKNELALVKVPDTKLNEKIMLETILADQNKKSSQLNTTNSDPYDSNVESPSRSSGLEKWNDYPCCYCGKRFRGAGKFPPSIVNTDNSIRERAKMRASKEHGLFADFERKVKLGDDYDEMHKAFLQQIEQSGKSQHGNRAFCSWVCVKRWTIHCCPMQMKYQNEMLIDMAAGYAVTI